MSVIGTNQLHPNYRTADCVHHRYRITNSNSSESLETRLRRDALSSHTALFFGYYQFRIVRALNSDLIMLSAPLILRKVFSHKDVDS